MLWCLHSYTVSGKGTLCSVQTTREKNCDKIIVKPLKGLGHEMNSNSLTKINNSRSKEEPLLVFKL